MYVMLVMLFSKCSVHSVLEWVKIGHFDRGTVVLWNMIL